MDLKQTAVKLLKGARHILLKDLQALPEEAFTKVFSDKTRTVADIVYEINLVNDHVGMVVRGEEPFIWPDGAWIYAPENFRTKEVVLEAFDNSSQSIVDTYDAFSPSQIEELIQTEDGETTRFERAQFMALHMWYHSGQLNYVQTLLGDDRWNWK